MCSSSPGADSVNRYWTHLICLLLAQLELELAAEETLVPSLWITQLFLNLIVVNKHKERVCHKRKENTKLQEKNILLRFSFKSIFGIFAAGKRNQVSGFSFIFHLKCAQIPGCVESLKCVPVLFSWYISEDKAVCSHMVCLTKRMLLFLVSLCSQEKLLQPFCACPPAQRKNRTVREYSRICVFCLLPPIATLNAGSLNFSSGKNVCHWLSYSPFEEQTSGRNKLTRPQLVCVFLWVFQHFMMNYRNLYCADIDTH